MDLKHRPLPEGKEIRVCVDFDFRNLNEACPTDDFPLPVGRKISHFFFFLKDTLNLSLRVALVDRINILRIYLL